MPCTSPFESQFRQEEKTEWLRPQMAPISELHTTMALDQLPGDAQTEARWPGQRALNTKLLTATSSGNRRRRIVALVRQFTLGNI